MWLSVNNTLVEMFSWPHLNLVTHDYTHIYTHTHRQTFTYDVFILVKEKKKDTPTTQTRVDVMTPKWGTMSRWHF